MNAKNDVVILSAVRTPIGRLRGSLTAVRPDDLAALVIRTAVERAQLDPQQHFHLIEEVYLGCANQAGEDNRNIARMALLLAGLPQHIAGVTVNRLCASGLTAINQAARAIQCGEGEIFVAGGVESMSRAPYSLPKTPSGNVTAWDTTLGWRYPNPALENLFPLEAMGETAENIYEQSRTGQINGGEISRTAQDAFALQSQQRAVAAINAGHFTAEIVPVPVPQAKGDPVLFVTDEHPFYRKTADSYEVATTLEKLAQLRPAFRIGGTVTAGNSSGLNDGATAVVLAARATAEKLGLKPLARWIGSAAAGVDPALWVSAPSPLPTKPYTAPGLP